MKEDTCVPKIKFVDFTYVDKEYHEKHSQYLHSHRNRLELLYIHEGSGLYYVDKHEYVVNAGNLVICNAGVTHGESPLRKNQMISLCCAVDGVKLEGLPDNCIIKNDQNPVLYFQNGTIGHIMMAMCGINAQSETIGNTFDYLANSLFELVMYRLRGREQIVNGKKKKQGEFITEIIDYLDKNYAEAITLESIAERFHISQSAFSRFFKAEVGISPIKYILCRRIGEAQSMLMHTNLSLGEIGSRVGYYDSSHFSAAFKKNTGLTPSKYRDNFIKKTAK